MDFPTKELILNGNAGIFAGIAANDKYFESYLNEDGFTDLTALVRLVVDDDSVCFDLGANIGVVSYLLSKKAFRGKVYSIEAAKTVFEILKTNIKLNSLNNVEALNVAVGEFSGEASFVDDSAWGFIVDPKGSMAPDPSKLTTVPVMTIAQIIDHFLVDRLDFIKIDLEGNEYNALKGSTDILKKYGTVIYTELSIHAYLAIVGLNPIEYVDWALSNFKYVYLSTLVASGLYLTRCTSASDTIHDAIYSNRYGCHDLLITDNDKVGECIEKWMKYAEKVADLERKAADLERKAADLERKAADLETKMIVSVSSEASLKAQLSSVFNSKTWRMTKPLRRWAASIKKRACHVK